MNFPTVECSREQVRRPVVLKEEPHFLFHLAYDVIHVLYAVNVLLYSEISSKKISVDANVCVSKGMLIYSPWSEDQIHAQSYLNREGGGRTRFPVLSDVEPACHLAERGVITIEIDQTRMRLIG